MKKKSFLPILFLIFFPLTLISGNLLSHNSQTIGGDSIDGYIEDGKYYITISKTEYKEVEKSVWILNLVFWITTFLFGLIAAVSMALSIIFYFLIPFYSNS
jgi:hypothetical protein